MRPVGGWAALRGAVPDIDGVMVRWSYRFACLILCIEVIVSATPVNSCGASRPVIIRDSRRGLCPNCLLPLMNWIMPVLRPCPDARSAVPSAAVVFPLPSPASVIPW